MCFIIEETIVHTSVSAISIVACNTDYTLKSHSSTSMGPTVTAQSVEVEQGSLYINCEPTNASHYWYCSMYSEHSMKVPAERLNHT